MNTISQSFKRYGLAGVLSLGLVAVNGLASAEVLFDFEGVDPLASSIISGDKANFAATIEQAHGGTKSLKFAPPALEPYKSFTYDIPMDTFTSGVISVWFYDTKGSFNTGFASSHAIGGAIILEDKNNLQDFVAIEIADAPYPVVGGGPMGPVFSPAYYATEGIDSLAAKTFDSGMAKRSIGFHKVEFHVTPTETKVYVDGIVSTKVAGPGSSTADLRLRIMNDTPSHLSENAGNDWTVAPHADSWGTTETWVIYDDIRFSRELPTPLVIDQGFEIVSGTPEYDAHPEIVGMPPFPPGNDNPYMNGFINYWNVTTDPTYVRSGSQAAQFVNSLPRLQSVAFDLTGVQPGTVATLWFYDLDTSTQHEGDKSAAILLEDANEPGHYLGVEIAALHYGAGGPRYYCIDGVPGNPFDSDPENDPYSNFYSGCFPLRSTGWHKVEIAFHATYTNMYVDGQIAHRNNINNVIPGPGLDKTLRLRILADFASQGGFGNYTGVTSEMDGYSAVTRDPYVYFDDISLPLPEGSSVGDWQMYE